MTLGLSDDKLTHFPPVDIFRCIFVNEKFCILIQISLKFVPKDTIANNRALVKAMAWHRSGDKPLSERMLTWFTDAYMRHYLIKYWRRSVLPYGAISQNVVMISSNENIFRVTGPLQSPVDSPHKASDVELEQTIGTLVIWAIALIMTFFQWCRITFLYWYYHR